MTEENNSHKPQKLYLPKYCILEINIRENKNISESAKIYFGELAVLANKYDKIFATDERLAEMKGVSIDTVKKWHKSLEEEGFIYRHTQQEPYKDKNDKLRWKKNRIMLLDQDPQKLIAKVEEFTLSTEGVKKYTIVRTCKNLHFNKNKKTDEKNKQQAEPVAVVVFPSLQKLDINETLKIRFSKEYEEEFVNDCVDRILSWKTRQSDLCAWYTVVERYDDWEKVTPKEKIVEENRDRLKDIKSKLKENKFMGWHVTIGEDYIEFYQSTHCHIFSTNDKSMQEKITKFIEECKKTKSI